MYAFQWKNWFHQRPYFRITFHNDTFFSNYYIGSFQSLQMTFLKVNHIVPVESIPVSSLLLFSRGWLGVFVTLVKLFLCDHSTLSCVCVNSLSQTIANTAILIHIVLHDSELKENIYVTFNMLIQILLSCHLI